MFRKYIQKAGIFSLVVALLASTVSSLLTSTANAVSGSDFNASRIMDDSIFFDGNTMSAQDIEAFLVSKVPSCDTNGQQPKTYTYNGQTVTTTRAVWAQRTGNPQPPYTCLRDYMVNEPAQGTDQYCTGKPVEAGYKIAAQVISDVARLCSINPKVLIVLLQKEQGLITDDWPWQWQYQAATGFACPDTAACDPSYAGLYNQLYYGARQYQRYAKLPDSYSYRAGRNNFIQYNPNTACGGSAIFIQNQATAGLYNYTPYQPNQAALNNLYGTGDGCSSYGNRNFWRQYTDWFGSPITGICYYGNTTSKTDVLFHTYNNSREDIGDFIIYGGTGSGCVESHIWNPGFGSWRAHIASNQPGVNPNDNRILYGDLDGNGSDYQVMFGVQNTGSGMIEAHIWNKDLRSYVAHVSSNLPTSAFAAADDRIILGDLNGDGKAEPIIVDYRNTSSGMVELHGWGNGMQSWAYHIITNLPAIDPNQYDIQVADVDGDGKDEAVVVALNNTGSHMLEFHVWNPGEYSWRSHIVSNSTEINPANSKVVFADVEGDRKDDALLVGLRGTSSGMIELHLWNPGFGSWRGHYVSNQSSPVQ